MLLYTYVCVQIMLTTVTRYLYRYTVTTHSDSISIRTHIYLFTCDTLLYDPLVAVYYIYTHCLYTMSMSS